MVAAYANKEDIVSRVADIVSTFHPEGQNPSGVKDSTYSKLVVGEDQ